MSDSTLDAAIESPTVGSVTTLAPVSLSKRWNYVGAQVFLPARPATDYTARVIRRCGGVAIPLEDARILWQR